MLHDVGNNRDCDVDVDHRNNTSVMCMELSDAMFEIEPGNGSALVGMNSSSEVALQNLDEN